MAPYNRVLLTYFGDSSRFAAWEKAINPDIATGTKAVRLMFSCKAVFNDVTGDPCKYIKRNEANK
jgi:hypothetical protein